MRAKVSLWRIDEGQAKGYPSDRFKRYRLKE
jgi:hypothetical protein